MIHQIEISEWDKFIFNNFIALDMIDTTKGKKQNIKQSKIILFMKKLLKERKINIPKEEIHKHFIYSISKQCFIGLVKDNLISLKKQNIIIYENIIFCFRDLQNILENKGLEASFSILKFHEFKFKIQKSEYYIELKVVKKKNFKNIILKHEKCQVSINTPVYSSILKKLAKFLDLKIDISILEEKLHPHLLLDNFIVQNSFLLSKKCKTANDNKNISINKLKNFLEKKDSKLNRWYVENIESDLIRNGPRLFSISSINKNDSTFVMNDNLINNLTEFQKELKNSIGQKFFKFNPNIENSFFNLRKFKFERNIDVTLEVNWNEWIWKKRNFVIYIKLDNKKKFKEKLTKKNLNHLINDITEYLTKKLETKKSFKKADSKLYKQMLDDVYKKMGLGKKWRRFSFETNFCKIFQRVLEENSIDFNEGLFKKIIYEKKKFRSFILDFHKPKSWSQFVQNCLLESFQNSYLILSMGDFGKYVDKSRLINLFKRFLIFHGLETENITSIFSILIGFKPGHITFPSGQTARETQVIIQKKLFTSSR